jgi:hypothetical protein
MTEGHLERFETLSGHMELRFNLGFEDPDTPYSQITWTGVITLRDGVFAITYEPTTPPTIDGDTFQVDEIWRIHDPADIEITDGVVKRCAGEGLIWGVDTATCGPGSNCRADGEIRIVTSEGPFDHMLTGHRVYWSGDLTEDRLGFSGTFSID